MEIKSNVIGRDAELFQLQDDFLREIIENKHKKKCLAYLISGRSGVGKSRMIEAFLHSLENDQRLAVHLPRFNADKHLFEYSCKKENRQPYLPFIEIQREIEHHYKRRRILRNVFMLLISWLPLNIHDMIEDLDKLRIDLTTESKTDEQKQFEIRTHARLLKNLHRLSKNVPLFFYIKNVQWIDNESLKLLQSIMEGPSDQSLWGMIILEENEDVVPDSHVSKVFKRLVDSDRMKKMVIKPLSKGFENKLMDEMFQPGLFTTNEFDHMYTLSEGYPGLLAKYVDDWMDKKWIFYEDGTWKKVSGFEDKIKPPIKKLLDLIIVFLQDGEISPRERELINSNAMEWDISETLVSEMIDLILKCSELGYHVERRVHKGTVSEHAFLAKDKNDDKLIVEYVSNGKSLKKVVVPREIRHPRLLPTKEILRSKDGILIVNDYYEGKTLREVQEKADEMHIRTVIQSAEQIAEGMAELHRNNLVHGFIRPETVIKGADGEIRLTAIDAVNLNIKKTLEQMDEISYFSYCSPEEIDNKEIDHRSDIFSFGILLFEMLTGELPFQAGNVGELKQAIRYAVIPDFKEFKLRIPQEVQRVLKKCLERNPSNRYQSAEEMIMDLQGLTPVSLELDLESEREVNQVESRRSVQLPARRKMIGSLGTLAAVILIVLAGLFIWKNCTTPRVVADTIVIGDIEVDNRTNNPTRISPEIIQYLIVDDVMQSTNKNIFTKSEFSKRWTKGRGQPQIKVSGLLTINKFDYEMTIWFKTPRKKKNKEVKNFGNPTALLLPDEGIISSITADIMNRMGAGPEFEESTFTQNWDAFEKFYQGEQAWLRLDITQAEESLRSALTYDKNFVLAKLRLAQVMNFNGSYLEAQELITEVLPQTTYLSRLDSLKAQAMAARLDGDYFLEIDLLRQIQDQFPTRKEAAYDLAEAYYQICDVENAITYYTIALDLDPDFARAHNHLAYCYTHLGQHDEALLHFEKYLSFDSTANAYDSYGDGLMSAGLYEKAAWAKKEGIKLDPRLNYLYGSLGFINICQGKYEEAEKNFNSYLKLSSTDQVKATGHFRLALISYLLGDYRGALDTCQVARELFDSNDINNRDHELHWLLGLIYLELGDTVHALQESQVMDSIIARYEINETKYQMKLLKSSLHLKAALASHTHELDEFIRISGIFDNTLQSKVKDHTSVFDLAYLNNSLGEILLRDNPNLIHLALERFNKAIAYNPNFALAHYNLWKCYEELNEPDQAEQHKAEFEKLWADADPDVKALYNM